MTNKEIFDFLTDAGMTEAGAAGMMGNLYHESGLIANRVEILCLKRLREQGQDWTDKTYTVAVDTGVITRERFLNPLPGKQYGYGLAQWTTPGRKAHLYDAAKIAGVSIGNMEMQLDFLIDELQHAFPDVWKVLTSSENVDVCTDKVLTGFEMPAGAEALKPVRRQTARKYLEKYGGDKMTIPEKALAWMEDLAADQRHGYSQANRWGPDYDCSSAIITAYQYAGVPVKDKGATYTGNMKAVFLKCGFTDMTGSCNLYSGAGMLPGDVLLNERHHTAMYAGSGKVVHARGQSFGSSATGDQGQEISISAYYNYPWDCVLRYGAKTGSEVPKVSKSTFTVSMQTIRQGSRGTGVKVWQVICGATVDGDFGPATHAATVAYQKNHMLEADGIVGPKTWAQGLSGV